MNPINVHAAARSRARPASYAKPGTPARSALAHEFELEPGERALVPTGVAIAPPEGYVGLASALARATATVLPLLSPGTVDSATAVS